MPLDSVTTPIGDPGMIPPAIIAPAPDPRCPACGLLRNSILVGYLCDEIECPARPDFAT